MEPSRAACGAGSANSVGGGAVLAGAGAGGGYGVSGLPDQPGLAIYGSAAAGTPLACGSLCIGSGYVREAVVFASGGTVNFLSNAPTGSMMQFWYRDPAHLGACGSTHNLSNVITVP